MIWTNSACNSAQKKRMAKLSPPAGIIGIPFYALNFTGRVCPDHRLLRSELYGGANAESVRAVQQLDQVRQAVRLCRQCGRRVCCYGHYARLERLADGSTAPCCAATMRRRINRMCCSGFERSCLPRMMLPVDHFEKPAIRRMAAGVAYGGRQEGQSGNLFCTRGAIRRVVRRRP